MRSTRLPRLLAVAAIGSVMLPVPALLGAAHASTSISVKVPLNQASWFWRAQVGVIGSTGVAPPQKLPNPSVPDGDLAVAGPEAPAAAGSPGGPLAESYLSFDLSSVPVGSTITSFKLSLPVDAGGVSANASAADMIACAPKAAWSGGESAAAYDGKPADACGVDSPKLTSADGGKQFSVDITALAQQWVKPNAIDLGVAISDNPANSMTVYQVVFGPAQALSQLTASVTYQPPAKPGPIVAGGGATAPPAPAQPSAPSNPGPLPTVAPPPSTLPTQVTSPQPAPVVAPTRSAVAAVRPADGSLPPLGFWVALALIVVLLGATTVVLADVRIAPTLTPDRGVAKALRTRLTLTHR